MSRTDRTPIDRRIIYGFIMEPIGLCLLIRFMETSVVLSVIGGVLLVWGGGLVIRHGRRERRTTLIIPIILAGWAAGVLWSYFSKLQQLRDNGVVTQAFVIDVGYINKGKAEESRWIAYRYSVGGKSYVSRNVSDDYYQKDSIWVYYDSAAPYVSEPIPLEEVAALKRRR